MKISDANQSILDQLWKKVQTKIGQAPCLEDAAQELAGTVYAEFEDAIAIARVFVTLPFDGLPAENKQFVKKLAESAGAGDALRPATPVLSLVGTHGYEADWCDRRKSKGHVGIPLISSKFVGAIPMIARLLQELGVPLHWVDAHDAQRIAGVMGESAGLFFVGNAVEATDDEGRKIIAAQDFVSTHKVKSVFGTGSAYSSGQMVVFVVFCREECSRDKAELFVPLSNLFKNETSSLAGSAKIFG